MMVMMDHHGMYMAQGEDWQQLMRLRASQCEQACCSFAEVEIHSASIPRTCTDMMHPASWPGGAGCCLMTITMPTSC